MLSKLKSAVKVYFDRRMLVMLFLGFSSGFPSSVFGSSLTWWLKSLNISQKSIGLFSLAKAPYSFKWLWSPVIDRVRLPFLHKLGRRRSWALLSQALLLVSILCMSQIDPSKCLWLVFVLAVFVVIASASQDVVLDAYRIEMFEDREQGAGTAVFVLGYRLGMIFSGAGALLLAGKYGWKAVYVILALSSLVGIITILFVRETSKEFPKQEFVGSRSERFYRFFTESIKIPALDFMKKANWKMVLLFVFLYKMSDAYMGPMAYVFYQDIGFTGPEIAKVSKIYGVIATIVGGLFGGLIVARYNIIKALFIGGTLQGLSNLMFVLQARVGHDVDVLTFVIAVENISGGIATAAFVAYLSSLCNSLYTATQYAILTSLVAVLVNIVSSSSGYLSSYMSWDWFFFITTLMAIPGMVVLYFIYRFEKTPEK